MVLLSAGYQQNQFSIIFLNEHIYIKGRNIAHISNTIRVNRGWQGAGVGRQKRPRKYPLWCVPRASEMRGGVYKNGGGEWCFQSTLCIWLSLFSITHTFLLSYVQYTPCRWINPHPPQPRPYRVNYAACTSSLRCYWRSWCLRTHGIFPDVLTSIPGEQFNCNKLWIAVSCICASVWR